MSVFDNRTMEPEIEFFRKAGILLGESAIVLERRDAIMITREGENVWRMTQLRRELVLRRL